MKKSNLLILSMLSMFFLLSACGSVEENDAQTIQSSEAAIQESVQQEQGEVTASETAENITENKEFIIQGVPLDRTSERTVYSDITHLLNESFNRFLIISLDVLICRYSPLFRAFPALFISEEPHKSFYYPSCFRSQK